MSGPMKEISLNKLIAEIVKSYFDAFTGLLLFPNYRVLYILCCVQQTLLPTNLLVMSIQTVLLMSICGSFSGPLQKNRRLLFCRARREFQPQQNLYRLDNHRFDIDTHFS